MDYPKTFCFEPEDVVDVVAVRRTIDDICPVESDSSLTYQLLQSLDFDNFKRKLKSLESRVILVDPSNLCEDSNSGDGRVCICRVEVTKLNKQFTVQMPKDPLDRFLGTKHLPKSFLVTRNSVSVIDAKLALYKNYKDIVDRNELRIFHELDSNKEFLLYCAKHTIDFFQFHLEKLTNSLPIKKLPDIVMNAANRAFSKQEIRAICQNIEIVEEDQRFGVIVRQHYFCRSPSTVQRIRKEIVRKTQERIAMEFSNTIGTSIQNHIQSMLEKQFLRGIGGMVCFDFKTGIVGMLIVSLLSGFVWGLLNPILGVVVSIAYFGFTLFTIFNPVDVNSEEWRNGIANGIFRNISKERGKIIANVTEKLRCIFEKTETELREIIDKMSIASTLVPVLDQNSLVKKWLLRDFRIDQVERCPSILHFIVGERNGCPVMKVFFEKSYNESEKFCRKHAVNKPKNALFEFVDVNLKLYSKRTSKGNHRERERHKIERGTKERIASAVKREKDILFAQYSNINGIGVSPVHISGGRVYQEPCIVLYCFDAKLIPFGEKQIPEYLDGFPCSIRESFIKFEMSDNTSQALGQGDSIKKEERKCSGSLGLCVKTANFTRIINYSLTAVHVPLREEVTSNLEDMKIDEDLKGDMHGLPSYEKDARKDDKSGQTSRTTKGSLEGLLPKRNIFQAKIYLTSYKCLSILDKDSKHFFKPGDYSAEMYVIDRSDSWQHQTGIGFGHSIESAETATFDFPKVLCFAYEEIKDIADALSNIGDICPDFTCDSFAKQLLKSLHVDEFQRKIQSLQSRVVLVETNDLCHCENFEGYVCIKRVNVKPFGKTLLVEKPDFLMDQFTSISNLPTVLLVSSSSVGTIDAKLSVYKAFKRIVDENNIRILHEYDSRKEFLIYCAKYAIDNFTEQAEQLLKSISKHDILKIVEGAGDIAFSEKEVMKQCQNIKMTSEDKIGSPEDRKYPHNDPTNIRKVERALISQTLDKVGECFVQEIVIGTGTKALGTFAADFLKPFLWDLKVKHSESVLKLSQHADMHSKEWRVKIASKIYKTLSVNKIYILEEITRKLREEIKYATEELKESIAKLTKASQSIPFVEQKELINEWMLREFRIENVERCPSILHFIAGKKNDKVIMKVFLRNCDSKSELFCRNNAVNVPKGAHFEFINVTMESEARKSFDDFKYEKLKDDHKRRETKKRIKEIVIDKRDELFAKHSNLISIRMNSVDYSKDPEDQNEYIVLYCLDEDLIPFGEEPLPKSLEEFECHVLVDFIQFGRCENCQALDHGCSVGRYGECSSGSLGFFAKKRSRSYRTLYDGFLTAAHVALTDDVLAELNETKLSDYPKNKKTISKIVHPSFEDGHCNNIIGQVEESFFGNFDSVGIDAAFIKTDAQQHSSELRDYFFNFDIDSDEEYDVIKKGRTTGETKGILRECTFAIRKPFPHRAGIYLLLHNCYSIFDSNSQIFFLPGDSGAAVYVFNKSDNTRQPLGLAFGKMTYSPITFVCPIDKIADVLNLSVLHPVEPMEVP